MQSRETELDETIKNLAAEKRCLQAENERLQLRLLSTERRYKEIQDQLRTKSRQVCELQKNLRDQKQYSKNLGCKIEELLQYNEEMSTKMENDKAKNEDDMYDNLLTIADLQQQLDWLKHKLAS